MSNTIDHDAFNQSVDPMDPAFAVHEGGKLAIFGKVALRDRGDLALAYTPGFTRVARAIAQDPELAYRYTLKGNTVAIVTDGSAVSGLGALGPYAALPVMEGKALLFKEFAAIDAFPICLGTMDADEIVKVVSCIAPAFGAIMLEDIAAPRCFEVEERLEAALSIPVLHDDQHAVAVAVTAALLNAARYVGKRLTELKVVVVGAGAAGTATAKLFADVGVGNIVACDRQGAIHPGRSDLGPAKRWFAEHANPNRETGNLASVLAGADVLVGLSGPGVIGPNDIRSMARDPIVFALANPIPEVLPKDVAGIAAVIATGRSDLPNQVDGGLCYPGLFRAALRCRAARINQPMKLAAARAIASAVTDEQLATGRVIPSIFDRVAQRVADAAEQAAWESGVARYRATSAAQAESSDINAGRST